MESFPSQKDEARKTMQQNAHDQLNEVFQGQERLETRVQAKEKNERASLEKNRADEKVLRLAQDQKREEEELRRKMIELEKTLDAKLALELEMVKLVGDDGGDEKVTKKLLNMKQELQDKKEKLEALEQRNRTLLANERRMNDELQEARNVLIRAFRELGHPFKIVADDKSHKPTLGEEDEKLKELSNGLGEGVYQTERLIVKLEEQKSELENRKKELEEREAREGGYFYSRM